MSRPAPTLTQNSNNIVSIFLFVTYTQLLNQTMRGAAGGGNWRRQHGTVIYWQGLNIIHETFSGQGNTFLCPGLSGLGSTGTNAARLYKSSVTLLFSGSLGVGWGVSKHSKFCHYAFAEIANWRAAE
ncbi:hypothetical protein XELAEV_18011538mg [Xenopus laevis]|uniref:Uncharacterized protein n=1 Tax=Xenopus laevis TaxID=8355 RepID=A0A974DNI7_XENLA|nr:hypothetical protein XELAEV_18011538mg [Xenopus laevis]